MGRHGKRITVEAFCKLFSFLALVLVLSTCKGPLFGLGGSVDLEAPKSISISPGSGSFRSGTIAISGVAQDSYGLSSATVTILDRSTGVVLQSYAATVSGSSWTTGAVVNTASFPDGQYTIAVTLKDARGNSSEDRVLLGFDNRPPTVLLEQPLDLSQEYNGFITIAGQAYDSLSSVTAVTVRLFDKADGSPIGDPIVSPTVPKWAVQFNAADPAFGLTQAELLLEVMATDEGGNRNAWHYELESLQIANAGNPVTASLLDLLDSKTDMNATVDGLAFNKATLVANRRDLDPDLENPPSILKVDVDSDKPTFTFVTPGEGSISEASAERYAGGTKANGTVSDDDNFGTMLAWYRYVPSSGDISGAAWSPATVEGTGYDQRWSFMLPGTNGAYKIQLRAQDKILEGVPTEGSVFSESAVRYVIIDDGRPLVTIDTNDPSPWKLYYGKDQTILVSGSAERSGFGNTIEDVEIQVGPNPWTDITGLSGLGTNAVTWSGYSLSLAGLPGGSTQVRVRAKDQSNVWGQAEVLIIMDVDAPVITINDPGSNLNGAVTFRGSVEDNLGDAFITVMDKVEARMDGGGYAQIAGTYSWSWPFNTQGLSDGAHTLWIRAWDTAGNYSETSRGFTVLQSTDKPQGAVNNLGGSPTVGGTFTVSGTAMDDDGVASADDGIQVQIERNTGAWEVHTAWTDIVSASRTGSPASYSWTYSLPGLDSGSYRLSVRVRDSNSVAGHYGSVSLPEANYWSQSAFYSFNVDNDVPVVKQAAFSPISGSFVNGSFTLTGSVTEDKGLAEIRIFINEIDRGTATPGGSAPDFTFSYAVNQAHLTGAGGANSIRVQATDNSGKIGIGTVQIIFDDNPPAVSFLTPDDGSTVNGIITVSGTASDNNQVASLHRAVMPAAVPPSWPGDYVPLAGQKYAFSFSLNTATLSDDSAYKVYVVAVDSAGNNSSASPASIDVTVDQDSDRPVIKLSNVDPDGLPVVTTLKMSTTVYGSVSDDDGTITLFETSENGSDWSALSLSGGTFAYNASAGDGPKTLYFRVTDKTGKVFATNGAGESSRPRIENGGTGVYLNPTAPISFNVDTQFPDVFSTVYIDRTSPYTFTDAVELTTNMALGGPASGKFALRILATDSSGIASVHIAAAGAAGSPFTATANGTQVEGPKTYTRYDTGEIDVTGGIPDGALALAITVTDGSGLNTPVSKTVIVDNTPPEYYWTTPALGEVVNGDIKVKGTALDEMSGLKSVEYRLGYNAESEAWLPVDGSIFSWEIDLSGSNKSDLFAGKAATVNTGTGRITIAGHGFTNGTAVYFSASTMPNILPSGSISAANTYYVRDAATDSFKIATTPGGVALDFATTGSEVAVSAESRDADNDQLWDFPVQLRVTDNAGNQKITVLGSYTFKLDPGGDRPRVVISYPEESGKTLGGIIRVYGLATDDDAVDSVYMQIDNTGDGVADSVAGIDWNNGGLGQQVTGSANWYRNINETGEFNPGSGTNSIWIRVRAKDIYGTFGAWTAWQEIIIDKNVPQFGSEKPLAIDTDATPGDLTDLPYSVGMWVKGSTVYLRGSITDDGAITDITVSGAVSGSLTANPLWFNAGYAGKGYDMAIPITLDAGTSGVKQLTVTAYDNSATPRESVYEIRFNYDNKAPTVTLDAVQSPALVAQSQGWYTIEGSASDDGADIDRVEVYLVRRSASGDRIYNPAQTNVSALLTTIDFTGDYPSIRGTASRGSTTTLNAEALKNRDLIMLGQTVLIGNHPRTISSYDRAGGLISWTGGAVELSETSYIIRLGIQIDHKAIVEGSAVASGTATRTPGQEKTLIAASLIGNPNIAVGNMLRINGQYRTVATWAPLSGTITWTGPDVELGTGQSFEVYSVTNDDADHYVEYLKINTGIDYTWRVSIKSDAIPDGPIEIHYIAFDGAGNSTHSVTTGYKIQNNGPRVGAIILGSDLNGNGTIEPAEETVQFAYDSDTAATESKSFALKVKDGPMYIEPVVTNGNGDLHLWMTGAYTLANHPFRTAGTIAPIELDDAALAAMGDGDRTFTMAIWDETEETIPGSTSLYVTRGATVAIDYVDETPPYAAIRPFYWNASDDNSLYGNSRANGHIEITGVYDEDDPDVSGQISLRGLAYDDQRITALYAYMDGFSFGGGTTKLIGAYTYTLIGSYAAGTWTPVNQWGAEGWKSSITDAGIGQDGHRASWQLDIDTSRITGVAATNRIVRIVAEDRASLPSPATQSSSTIAGSGSRLSNNSIVIAHDDAVKPGQLIVLGSGNQAYASRISSYNAGTVVFSSSIPESATAYAVYLDDHQAPFYQMDVVPYITKIENPAGKGLGNDVLRSSAGRYSMDIDTNASNRMQVSGFNLGGTGYLPSARISAAPITAPSGQAPATSLVSASSVTIAKTMAASRSGYLTVFVNGVPSINNFNLDAAPFNKENETNKPHTQLWTDDRYLSFWTLTTVLPGVSNQTFYYPSMVMHNDQPYFGYTNNNDGYAWRTTGDATYQKVVGRWFARNAVLAKSANATPTWYVMSNEDNFTGDRAGFLHVALDNSTDRAAMIGDGSNPYQSGTGVIELCGVEWDGVVNGGTVASRHLNRFMYPNMIATGNQGAVQFYISYFDAHPDRQQIQFFAFKQSAATTTNLNEADNDNEIADNGNLMIPGTKDTSSQYTAMTLVGSDVAIAYYDSASTTLKLSYSSNAILGTGLANTGATWTALEVDSSTLTGANVSMASDGTYVYLAYVDGADANLKLSTIKWSDKTITTVTVDAYQSVGTWTNVQLINGLPVITYYNNSYNGTRNSIKIATPVAFAGRTAAENILQDGAIAASGAAKDEYTGNWECATVPTLTAPQGGKEEFVRVQLGSYTSNTLTLPVVGWLGTPRLEYAKLAPNN